MPAYSEQHFRWTWELVSPPEALWPLVSNTDRFNRDCGYPPVTLVPPAVVGGALRPDDARATPEKSGRKAPPTNHPPVTNARRLHASVMGLVIEWDELAFEWLAPTRYGVERTYYSGPVAKMLMFCELIPRAGGGTTLTYDMRLTPSSLFGRFALPFSIGKQARATTERVFRQYDEFAQRGLRVSQLAQKPRLAAGGAARLDLIGRTLVADAAQPAALVEQ